MLICFLIYYLFVLVDIVVLVCFLIYYLFVFVDIVVLVCFSIYLLDGLFDLNALDSVLDIGVRFLALWVFDPCIK